MSLPTIQVGEPAEISAGDDVLAATLSVLFKELRDREYNLRRELSYLNNHPVDDVGSPLIQITSQDQSLRVLRNLARTNFARLIVSATTDRLGIHGFKTAEESGEDGDEEAARLFALDRMGEQGLEAMRLAISHGVSYLVVDPFTGRQKIVPPSNGAVITDAVGEVQAALVIRRERAAKRDVLDLFLREVDEISGEATGPTRIYRATRPADPEGSSFVPPNEYTAKTTRRDHEIPIGADLAGGWKWLTTRTVNYQRIHVTPLVNEGRMADFTPAVTIIDRITHMRWQRLVVATLQGLRQRAISGNLPKTDPDTGEEIDYNEMFAIGPGSLWRLPEGANIWESSPASYADNTAAVNDDKKELAALTKTPMSYLSDATNQSAEGAGMLDDLYLSKIDDRRNRFGVAWQVHMSNVFEAQGDSDRSDLSAMEIVWEPIKVWSITESAAAFASLISAKLPLETAAKYALGMSPKQIRELVAATAMAKLDVAAIPAATPLNRMQALNAEQQQQAKENRPAVGRKLNSDQSGN